MSEDEIKMILQNHKEHLLECKQTDELTSYWDGALDCVECLAEKLGVELE